MNRSVRIYVGIVMIAAIAATVGLYMSAPTVDAAHVRVALVFFALGVFTQFLSYQLTPGATGSIAFIPYLAIIATSPNWLGVLAGVSAFVVVEITARRAPIKATFNIAQQALAGCVCVFVYRASGGESLLVAPQFNVVPLLALLAAFIGTNSLAVSVVVALSSGRRALDVWRDNTSRTIGYDLLSLPVVYAFAWVYANAGPTGVALLAVPVLGVRQLYISNWQLEKSNQELLELMVAAIEARDPYTSGHSRRVSNYSKIIARAIGLGGREVERVGVAALLHDVGKIHEVFAPILRKPDRLTPEEWEIMKTHPIKSAELAQYVSQLKDVIPALRHHHENWDGTGYPDGLAGEEIPLYARVVMFADTIDAMTTDRPYRAALRQSDVADELVRMRGKQFDPRICDALLASPLFSSLFQEPTRRPTPRSSERLSLALTRSRRIGA